MSPADNLSIYVHPEISPIVLSGTYAQSQLSIHVIAALGIYLYLNNSSLFLNAETKLCSSLEQTLLLIPYSGQLI